MIYVGAKVDLPDNGGDAFWNNTDHDAFLSIEAILSERGDREVSAWAAFLDLPKSFTTVGDLISILRRWVPFIAMKLLEFEKIKIIRSRAIIL